MPDRFECPVLAHFVRIGQRGSLLNDGRAGSRVGRAHFYPGNQIGDLFVRKLAAAFAGGHLKVFVGVTDGLDQKTLVRIPAHDGGPGVAALEQTIARIEQESAFDFFGVLAVTFVAVLDKDGPDFFLKELDAGRVGFGRGRPGEERPQEHGCSRKRDCLGDAFLHARCKLTRKIWARFTKKSFRFAKKVLRFLCFLDFDNPLVDGAQLVEAQFAEEALLINAFDQARPLESAF